MVNYSKLPTQFVETLILHANTSYQISRVQDLEVAGGGVNPQNETASHEADVICRYALFILIQSFYMILYAFIIRFKC